MGNREDLLAGAKRCLLEKGYSRTTARDIANASDVSLAAIGYHFGSKDALMNEAMFEAIGEWGDELEQAFKAAGPSLDGRERFERIWGSIIERFDENRPLWLSSFELIMQVDHVPAAKAAFRQAMPMARSGLTALFTGVEEDTIDEATAMSVGGVYYSLMAGLLIQRFADPDQSPSPSQMAAGLRAVAATLDPAGSSATAATPTPTASAEEATVSR